MERRDKLVSCPEGAIQIKSVSNSGFLNEVERPGHPIVIEVDVIKKSIGEFGRVTPTLSFLSFFHTMLHGHNVRSGRDHRGSDHPMTAKRGSGGGKEVGG